MSMEGGMPEASCDIAPFRAILRGNREGPRDCPIFQSGKLFLDRLGKAKAA